MATQLTEADLLETYVDEDGKLAMWLTSEGARVARKLAMSDDDGQGALMAAMLEQQQGWLTD